jgi:hypothetical protein
VAGPHFAFANDLRHNRGKAAAILPKLGAHLPTALLESMEMPCWKAWKCPAGKHGNIDDGAFAA